MENVLSFLWTHPSLTAIILYAILVVVIRLRNGRRYVDQQKDTMYGPAKGYTGRTLERNWKAAKDFDLFKVATALFLIFLAYRFFKMIG